MDCVVCAEWTVECVVIVRWRDVYICKNVQMCRDGEMCIFFRDLVRVDICIEYLY